MVNIFEKNSNINLKNDTTKDELWPILRYCSVFRLGGLNKNEKASISILDNLAKERTRTNPKLNRCDNLLCVRLTIAACTSGHNHTRVDSTFPRNPFSTSLSSSDTFSLPFWLNLSRKTISIGRQPVRQY